MKLSNLALWSGALDAAAVEALGGAGSAIVPTPGDFDLDGDVDGDDLTDPTNGWEARFGADLDGGNFLDWQRNFGTIPPLPVSATAIPEPTSGLLLLIAVVGIISRHGRRTI